MRRLARNAIRHFVARLWPNVTGVILLGCAVGFLAVIVAVVDTVLVRPLPFGDSTRLVTVFERRDAANLPTTAGNYREWRELSRSFAALGAYAERPPLLLDADEPQSLKTVLIDAALLATLELRPVQGRTFTADEERGDARVVMLSHAVWRQRFGQTGDLEDLSVKLDGITHTVVGVVSPEVRVLLDADVFLPLRTPISGRGQRVVYPIARLRQGVAEGDAAREMSEVVSGLETRDRDNTGFRTAVVVPLRETLFATLQGPIVGLGVLAVILAIGVMASLLGMQFLQAEWRRRDMATREALGASRFDILLELACEGVVFAAFSMVVALSAAIGLRSLVMRLTDDIWLQQQLRVGWAAVGVAALLCAAVSLAVSLAPALLRARGNLHAALRRRSAGGGASRVTSSVQAIVMVGQTALATAFAIAAVTIVADVWRLDRIDPGFDIRDLWAVDVKSYGGSSVSVETQGANTVRIVEALGTLPGVKSAGATNRFPLVGLPMSAPVTVRGFDAKDVQRVQLRLITPGYFETLSVPLLAGRLLQHGEDKSRPLVAVTNEAFARRYWPNADPIGREVRIASGPWFMVVGVVGSVRSVAIEAAPEPELYVSTQQVSSTGEMSFVLRTHGGMLSGADVRNAVRRASTAASVVSMARVETLLAKPGRPRRFGAALVTILAAVSVLLAVTGLYSLSAYAVSLRRRELAIRLACGATERRLARSTTFYAAALHGCGITIGTVGVLLAGPWLAQVAGVSKGSQFLTIALPAALFLVGGALASYLPAHSVIYGPLRQALQAE